MQYIHRVLILGLLFLIIVGCAASSDSLLTAKQLVSYGVAPEDADMDALRRGRAMAVRECAACHRFYFPKEYSSEEWPKIIRKMGKRMGLDQRTIADLDLYFQLASRSER